jgi:NitT/TauT family transport system ATP-binding protein
MTQLLTERPAAVRERSGEVAVRLQGVTKTFGHGTGATVALDRVSIDVRRGEFLCLVGASGCGKSTILNLVAGLDRPSGGVVDVPAGRATLMFQDAALFPWLTVEQNVAFPLQMRRVSKAERRREVDGLLEMVHLDRFRTRRPHELSGGMRQRVALARALAHGADVLLMDEPFGALDAMMRDRLHEELERVWRESGRTVMFVTHNVREAVRLGDRVVLLSSGPGRVAAEFEVDITRPRRIDAPEVAALAAAITDRLRDEAHGHRGA